MKHLFTATLGIAGVALAFAITAAAGDNNPPGRDPCSHGATGKPCRPDPQPTHGKDCDHHGNNGGVNEAHCGGTTTPAPPITTTCGTCGHTTTTTPTTTVTTTTPTPPTPCNCPPATVAQTVNVSVSQTVIVQAPPTTTVQLTTSSTATAGAVVLTITCPASSGPQTIYVVTAAGTIPVTVPAGQTTVTVVVPKGAVAKPPAKRTVVKKTAKPAKHKTATKRKPCKRGWRVYRGKCHPVVRGARG